MSNQIERIGSAEIMSYGLCGKSLKHSYSEIIHNLLGNSDYHLMNFSENEFSAFLTERKFCAVNVTIPYKTIAFEMVDVVSDEAKRIGCVNTVVNKNGTLYGYNTDCFGFEYMLKRAGINVQGKKVILLGSGATSLTARTALSDLGALEIVNVSRSGEINYKNVYNHNDAHIIVNTTPVGMYPDNGKSLLCLESFTKLEGCADVIYNPLKTKFISDAQKLNIKTANGLSMLVAQALAAHELFFDKPFDDREQVIEKILKKLETKVSNIVLVGMPGSGKTTVGKILSEQTGMPFYDTDEYLEKKFTRKIPDIINTDGEQAFRKMETEVLEELTKMSGCIIATGGGAVLAEQNRYLLKQNGKCVYIKRDISKLATTGRPLSSGGMERLEELFRKRSPIYESLSDFSVDINENSKECAEKIIKQLLYV